MSTMNILMATLILLIVAAGMALFFGMRAAQAHALEYPGYTPVAAIEAPLEQN